MYASFDKEVAQFSFWIFIKNTVIVIGYAILMEVFLCSLTAYPLSRLLTRKTSNVLTVFFLATMMVPSICIMIPQFMMFKSLGFYDNYFALLVPYLYPYPFYTFLFKGFFDQIPESLFDAARIDGTSEWYNYSLICMPLSKPIISMIALSTFLSNWNDFFWAWLVTEKQSLWTLNVALYNISQNELTKQNFLMGLSIITILPVILLTVIFSEQIKRSVVGSGIKG
jgi:ABC-type glycerol-3-phosphate transport system permease component